MKQRTVSSFHIYNVKKLGIASLIATGMAAATPIIYLVTLFVFCGYALRRLKGIFK